MINKRQLARSLAAASTTLLLAAAPVTGFAEEAGGVDAERIEAALESSEDALEEALGASYEGYATVLFGEALQEQLSADANGQDFSWLESGTISLKEAPNGEGGADLELTYDLNGEELYHAILSYDGQTQILYALCPELKDQTIAVPVGELSQSAVQQVSGQISPELLQAVTELGGELQEFVNSIPPQTLMEELARYVAPIAERVSAQEGSTTATAGSLEATVATQTYSVSSQDMAQLIPELLDLLSKDELLESALKSDFANSALALALEQSKSDVELTGEDVYTVLQETLTQAAGGDFSDLFGAALTVGFSDPEDGDTSAFRLSVALEQSGMSFDLFTLTGVASGLDHAVEFALGPVIASALGIGENEKASLLLEGSISDELLLNETVSLNAGAASASIFEIRDLELLALDEGKVVGTFVVNTDNESFAARCSVDEDEARRVELLVDDALYVTVVMKLAQTDSVQIDPVDKENPFTVASQEDLDAYMRDADAVGMLEKLKDAGVPAELVDQLTADETGTESSKENTEEAQ